MNVLHILLHSLASSLRKCLVSQENYCSISHYHQNSYIYTCTQFTGHHCICAVRVSVPTCIMCYCLVTQYCKFVLQVFVGGEHV